MPSREVVYRVQLDTAAARREATGFRRQIERDLSIDVGSTSGGTKQAAAETTSFNKALTGLNKTLGIFGLALGAQQLYNWTVGLASLGTEAARAQIAFNNLAGGAAQAAANVRSIQSASGGTVSSLDAIKIGNQAAALSLAKTAEEFGNVTRAGRIVALISPVIHDISSAISELGLASANLSFRRLDQLGLSVQEVREGMADLRAENASLSESQAFLQASMAALERKGGDILDSTEAQATGFEKLAVAIAEARRAMGEGWLGQSTQAIAGFLANSLNELNVLFAGATAETSVIEASLDSITTAYKNQSNILENTPWLGDILKK
jgi:hypothetical protein